MKKVALKFYLALLLSSLSTFGYAKAFNVVDYGAKGDKTTTATSSIQAAITACSQAGGGTVYFPAGDYLSGTIRILDNVSLYLEKGATIWCSRLQEDYKPSCLIFAQDAKNISIEGSGTLYGIGEAELGRRAGVKFIQPKFRVGLVNIINCKDVSVRGIKFYYSDNWTLHLSDCEDVIIDGITIKNNYFHNNSDGIDPVSCKNVVIANCNISAGDDCIVLKSSGSKPCENVVVTNCTMESVATAVKLGTESPGDFRDIHFSNCTIRNTTVGIGIFLKDGGTVERVSFSNITVENYAAEGVTNLEDSIYPIFVDIEKRNPDSRLGKIRDITFDNINIYSGFSILVQGMAQNPIENLTLKNINFRVYKPGNYSDRRKHIGGNRTTSDERDTLFVRKPSYVTVAHINGLTAENIKVYSSKEDFDKYQRSAFSVNETKNGVIRSVFRNQPGTNDEIPVISLGNCENILVTDCIAEPGTPVVVGISGQKTANISIETLGMEPAAKVYRLTDVSKSVVHLK
jgi:polygalacturonase